MSKIKLFLNSEFAKDLLIVLIIILISVGSFFLGRLSKNTKGDDGGLQIESRSIGASAINAFSNTKENANVFLKSNPNLNKIEADKSLKNFFASKKGKKYYPSGCPSGQSIKIENRIFFDTEQQAEEAGYTASSSC